MDSLIHVLEIKILGNSLKHYLLAVFLFAAAVIALKFIERFLIRKLKEIPLGNHADLRLFLTGLAEKYLVPLLYFGAFYFSVIQLVLGPGLAYFIHALAVIVLTVQCSKVTLALSLFFIDELWIKKHAQEEAVLAFKSILTILKLGVWSLAVVFILDNLGFNVSAVVAGLGIGGVAVALAAQTILGDLFNYFVIFFDKPFGVGDSIAIGDYTGSIEHIGIKTTRIRSADGEQLILSNSSLASSAIRNFRRMQERRVAFTLGVVYQTPTDQLKKIPEMLEKIVRATADTRFERAHFFAFGPSSLDIEVVYHVAGVDYKKYMDIREKINLGIKDVFEKEKIEFAYPTQTVFTYAAETQGLR